MSKSARELYLASLDPASELSARRLAEQSGVPDNDPLWMLLHEVNRSIYETVTSAKSTLANESFASRLSVAVATSVVNDERIAAALTTAIRRVQEGSVTAIRSIEVSIREFGRHRVAAPFASIVFAFLLALSVGCGAFWSTCRIAVGYGRDLGYHAGFNDGVLYGRNHR